MATIDHQAFASVNRFLSQCSAAGLNLAAPVQENAAIVVRGGQVTPDIEVFIARHHGEIVAALKSQPAIWRLAADRKIAATLDSLRSWRQRVPWEWPVEFEDLDEWESASALIEVALILHSDADLDDALRGLKHAFMAFYLPKD